MAEKKPKEVDLEEELDFLYRKVSSSDQSENNVPPTQQSKTQALVPEVPMLHVEAEKRPLRRREVRRFRVSRIILLLLPPVILGSVTFFFWPMIYYYDALNYDGKVYPLRINRFTGGAAYFDGAGWLRPPIPPEAKNVVPQKEIAQLGTVPSPEASKIQVPPAEPQAAARLSDKHDEFKYAIQIKAFPENKRKAAEAFVDEAKKNLPDIRIETVQIKGRGIWHRVLVGRFSTIKEASEYLKERRISGMFRDSFVQKKSFANS